MRTFLSLLQHDERHSCWQNSIEVESHANLGTQFGNFVPRASWLVGAKSNRQLIDAWLERSSLVLLIDRLNGSLAVY
jgi:hypothetical protein